MKKVLVTGAALLIAGSLASAAYAEVNLSGDARVRYVGKSDYGRAFVNGTEELDGYHDYFDSRIRVKFDAKAKGGAFMKARLRFDDFKWDGQGWGAYKDDKNVWADYAYIGVPMGPVTFTGGRMPADFSKFFSWDNRPTRAKLDYKSGNFRLIGLIDVIDEFTESVTDEWNDNDFMAYGLVAALDINDDWSVKAYARYQDDQREWDTDADGMETPHADQSGFLGSIHANGKIASVNLEGEFAFKAADVLNASNTNQDDGYGWYLQGTLDMGAFVPGIMVGGTYNGYVADDDFGFIMLGAAEPITVADVGNEYGDLFFAALTANYAVSDQFRLAGNLVYADASLDDNEAGTTVDRVADFIEVSGSATYIISEGADLTYKLGYLKPDWEGRVDAAGVSDDAYVGQYLRMAIKF